MEAKRLSDGGVLLDIRGLRVRFPMRGRGPVCAVNGVDLTLRKGESLGIVGESGCGKSVTFSSVMRLVQSPPAVLEGEILLDGRDVMRMSGAELRRMRGKEIAMIFQEPMTSLNPVMRVGKQIIETLRLHESLSEKQAEEKALEYFQMVEIPDARSRFWCYPHQLSGGLRQRVMIAMALICNPRVLLADEPTTALDVTIQAQILELLGRLRRKNDMSVVLITHDLCVIAQLAERVAVFYAGRVVEEASAGELFANPMHPYTMGLLRCVPTMRTVSRRLDMIEGNIPDPACLPAGCAFHPRCPFAADVCREQAPEKRFFGERRFAACHRAGEVG
jgi:peptide/nickel transport system ATP-binding protein/oligopeptide transport system ATP-binding protein